MRRDAFWSGLEAGVGALFSVVTSFAVARIIGPAELGVGASAVAVHVVLWVAVNALFADALVQMAEVDGRMVSSAFWASSAVGMLASSLQAGAGYGLAVVIGDGRLGMMGLVLAAPLPLVGAAGVMQGLMTRERAYRRLAMRTLVGQGLGTAVGVAAGLAGAGGWALVCQQAVTSGAGALTLLVGPGLAGPMLVGRGLTGARLDRRAPAERNLVAREAARRAFSGHGWTSPWCPHLDSVRALLRVGLPLTASTLVLIARYRLFAVLIGASAGPAVLGQVHLAFRLVDTVRDLAFTALWRLMLPCMAEQRKDRTALLAQVDRWVRRCAVAMLPVCVMMGLGLSQVVPLLMGPKWQEAGRAAAPLVALMAWSALTFPAGVALITLGQVRFTLYANLASLVAGCAAVLVHPPADAMAAVVIWTVSQAAVSPYALWTAARALRVGMLRPVSGGFRLGAC